MRPATGGWDASFEHTGRVGPTTAGAARHDASPERPPPLDHTPRRNAAPRKAGLSRRPPEFSAPGAGESSSASRERASRLPAETSWSRAAARSLAAGFLLGFAALNAPLPAAAQNIHSTTITVGSAPGTKGYEAGNYGSITDGTFTYNSVDYTFHAIYINSAGNLSIQFTRITIDGLSNVYFYVEGIAFAAAEKTGDSNDGLNTGWFWRDADEDGISWSSGDTVTIDVEQTALASTDATLSALALSGVTLSPTFESSTEPTPRRWRTPSRRPR